MSTNNIYIVTFFAECIYSEKGSQFEENMKKYNEDKVNYTNSKWPVFEVGIM